MSHKEIIKSRAPTTEYRSGWDNIFKKKKSKLEDLSWSKNGIIYGCGKPLRCEKKK